MERILEKLGMRTRLILSFGLVLLVAMLGTTLSICLLYTSRCV